MELLSRFFKQDELSDCDVLLVLAAAPDDAAPRAGRKRGRPPGEGGGDSVLARFPGHLIMLCQCPFFNSQVGGVKGRSDPSSPRAGPAGAGHAAAQHGAQPNAPKGGKAATARELVLALLPISGRVPQSGGRGRGHSARLGTRALTQASTPPLAPTTSPCPRHVRAQVQFAQAAHGGAGSSSSSSSQQRPQLRVSLDAAEQLGAAEAVIACLYGRDDVGSLPEPQLVQAVLLADRLQLQAAIDAAGEALCRAAAAAPGGLADATLDALRALPVWPACLLPVAKAAVAAWASSLRSGAEQAAVEAQPGRRMRRLLLAVLGDLEAAWASEQLSALLLALPPPAMQLLLASDGLAVACEDTVLFTAAAFSKAQPSGRERRARRALAPLVRCPQLSQSLLWRLALTSSTDHLLVAELGLGELGPQAQLSKLAQLKQALPEGTSPASLACSAVRQQPGSPASWCLGPRQLRPLADVRVAWRLPVSAVEALCRHASERSKAASRYSPPSPPLGGLAWRLELLATPTAEGVWLGLFLEPVDAPADVACSFNAELKAGGTSLSLAARGVEDEAEDEGEDEDESEGEGEDEGEDEDEGEGEDEGEDESEGEDEDEDEDEDEGEGEDRGRGRGQGRGRGRPRTRRARTRRGRGRVRVGRGGPCLRACSWTLAHRSSSSLSLRARAAPARQQQARAVGCLGQADSGLGLRWVAALALPR